MIKFSKYFNITVSRKFIVSTMLRSSKSAFNLLMFLSIGHTAVTFEKIFFHYEMISFYKSFKCAYNLQKKYLMRNNVYLYT